MEIFFKKTHYPCFSENFGLKVEYLNGKSGIYSSKYSKTKNNMENIKKLLSNVIKDTSKKEDFFVFFV
ncbi:non-canonical purine NTP pyrophosphatase [Blattabacterium cuenoti]|uniref:non-canonical purine NTP pyrophosphatase n=1 Tax=Blattabacterium cuenoti TaxID=1653831 RepID=UPI0021CED853|nr:non-canonical purine NTP pyrophosphatase [Blattabacterium cuenoti]